MARRRLNDRRILDRGLLVFLLVVFASAVATPVEHVVNVVIAAILGLLLVRAVWPHTIGEWRKDRALLREVRGLTGPGPIYATLEGVEVLVYPEDPRYPLAMAQVRRPRGPVVDAPTPRSLP